MRMGRHGRLKAIANARDPKCRQCSFYQSSKHVCIMGRGSLMSPIFAVGEAPGSAEAGMGLPFMGPAGQLFDRVLVALGMQHLVYISNVVHCRPPGNQKPSPFEISTCLPYLIQELSIVRPRVIVLMGRTAMDAFGVYHRNKPAFLDVGMEVQAWTVGTWHPAYCLRTGEKSKQELKEAFEWARRSM